MKCEGCEKGLPIVMGFLGGLQPENAALHYWPGSEQPAGLCIAPVMDPVANEVVAWEGEGGRTG